MSDLPHLYNVQPSHTDLMTSHGAVTAIRDALSRDRVHSQPPFLNASL